MLGEAFCFLDSVGLGDVVKFLSFSGTPSLSQLPKPEAFENGGLTQNSSKLKWVKSRLSNNEARGHGVGDNVFLFQNPSACARSPVTPACGRS